MLEQNFPLAGGVLFTCLLDQGLWVHWWHMDYLDYHYFEGFHTFHSDC
jgi:hypothetical protein